MNNFSDRVRKCFSMSNSAMIRRIQGIMKEYGVGADKLNEFGEDTLQKISDENNFDYDQFIKVLEDMAEDPKYK